MTRLRSAVTRPPPPRRATRSPCSSRPKETGPRLETTISFRRTRPKAIRAASGETGLRGSGRRADDRELGPGGVVAEQLVEERKPVAEQPRREEMAAHVLLA